MQRSGSRKNDIWFAEEDEEENNGCLGVCIFFLVTLELNGGIYTITVLRDSHRE